MARQALEGSDGWPLEPIGPDFSVASFDFGGRGSSTAMSRTGATVAAWSTPFCCISAQGLDSNGGTVGGHWNLDSASDGTPDPIDVTSLPNDEFLLAWEGDSPAFEEVISVRRFELDGIPAGQLVEIASGSDGSKNVHPEVVDSHVPIYDYLVTWARALPGTTNFDILLHTEFAPGLDSNLASGDLVVNSYTTGDQLHPSIAGGGDSSFVVVWGSEGSPESDTDGLSVQARCFCPGGSPDQFQVNSTTAGDQALPEVAMTDDGRFLVVWSGPPEGAGPLASVHGRMFEDGMALGPDFQISTATLEEQLEPVVESRSDGSFLVVWRSPSGVWGRIVDPSGTPAGSVTKLNSTEKGGYRDPNVAGNGSGQFVVSWVGNDGSYYGRGRRVRLFREPLFSDGFESGNTSAWSLTVE